MIDLKDLREQADEAADFHLPFVMNPMQLIAVIDERAKLIEVLKAGRRQLKTFLADGLSYDLINNIEKCADIEVDK